MVIFSQTEVHNGPEGRETWQIVRESLAEHEELKPSYYGPRHSISADLSDLNHFTMQGLVGLLVSRWAASVARSLFLADSPTFAQYCKSFAVEIHLAAFAEPGGLGLPTILTSQDHLWDRGNLRVTLIIEREAWGSVVAFHFGRTERNNRQQATLNLSGVPSAVAAIAGMKEEPVQACFAKHAICVSVIKYG